MSIQLDLSEALGVRFGDQDVSEIRMANQTIWSLPEEPSYAPLPGTVLGRWPLRDSLLDVSGNNRHGFAQLGDTAGVWDPVYVVGPTSESRALRFDGSVVDQSINWGQEGLMPTTLGWTAMWWFRARIANGDLKHGLFARCRGTDSTRGGSVAYNADAFTVMRWKDDLRYWGVRYANSGDSPLVWHHMAIVDTNTEATTYVDGVETMKNARSLDDSSWTGWESYPWRTGWVDGGLGNSRGEVEISNIRFFHGGLTQSEIQQAMAIID